MDARAALIAVDGANGPAVLAAGRRALASTSRRRRAGVSRWDASGLFEQLVVADSSAGRASARTLLLLYAADLAFRLRWEIEPAMADGKTVVAAPYVDTAIAFGRAAGLHGGWLKSLFDFAVRPTERSFIAAAAPSRSAKLAGFVEFGCGRLAGHQLGFSGRELAARTRRYLAAAASKASRPRSFEARRRSG